MITDPAAMELLGDDTRRRIIYLLRARELTISQIAEELRMTLQAIYHHIKKLLPAEMVEVTREESRQLHRNILSSNRGSLLAFLGNKWQEPCSKRSNG